MRPLRLLQHASLIALTCTLTACGERISEAQLDAVSSTLADVMVAVQRGIDSTSRARIADSVARARGYDGWQDLREEIGDVATEPDKLRTLLDSAQRRIEARTR